jgi:anti-anti-sigma factor
MKNNYESILSENFAVLKVTNEKLDCTISADIKNALTILIEKGYKNLIMDLSPVKYCDSSGLSSILVGNRLCKNNGGTFLLTGVNEMVNKVIHISQLNSILKITPTIEDAKIYLKN